MKKQEVLVAKWMIIGENDVKKWLKVGLSTCLYLATRIYSTERMIQYIDKPADETLGYGLACLHKE